ncbi:tRNA pseudouridine32 synthase / 23S rRNA pseudouridine746 synthase [Cohaesibacter gelatinilyticus]|uniref:Pseudouridine synthase n=2 Tax=Cohaesibacter gelatinilyticus TaxID=372072 RepID=A0A285PH02_9HYPH|nr:tRNA pseudouridine32 synthase / 23S rRNA pseudouridine746 synthase [Cohaesibacter gelatinilyticus]
MIDVSSAVLHMGAMRYPKTDHAPSLTPPLVDYAPPMDPYLNVVHEDEHILVFDKPTGLLSVPGKAAEHQDCLEHRAVECYGDARIVHRLDMDTSGVMVLARTADALRNLGRQFQKRKTSKQYVARVWGQLKDDEGHVDLPLICDWPSRPKQMVCFERGKPAQTDWKVIGRDEKSTLVRLSPITGRSHQLRVHMLSLGHVILGDRFYAKDEALTASDRLCLHAEYLGLIHPATGEWMDFSSPISF